MSAVFPIEEDTRYRRYTASAGQTNFPIPFPFQQNDDIKILLQTAPSQYTEIPPSDYTLSGANNPAGGSVTLLAGRTAGDIILILGEAVIDRLTSIVTNGRFRSDLTDGELDRNRIILMEQKREGDRSLRVDYGATGYTIANDLQDGDTLMVDGDRFVAGPNAADIQDAQGNAVAAAASAAAALASKNAAASSATLAGRWASAPEDEEVTPGSGLYSAYHWYRKVLAIWTLVVAGFVAAINAAAVKTVLDDNDRLTGTDSANGFTLIRYTLANLISSIFKTSRTIPNVSVQASTFRANNAGGFSPIIDPSALTADRAVIAPNRPTKLGTISAAIIAYQVAQNVSGGAAVATTWTTRPLNLEISDPDNIVSISANQFTITEDCFCQVDAAFYASASTAMRIWNVTDGVSVADSLNMANPAANSSEINCRLAARLPGGKTYRIEYYTSIAQSPNGLGLALNITGRPETYMLITLETVK